jgi:hypothetical protein
VRREGETDSIAWRTCHLRARTRKKGKHTKVSHRL